ncbi:MAG: hypothetical protein R2750_00585 [Bacteroidales bacterium]
MIIIHENARVDSVMNANCVFQLLVHSKENKNLDHPVEAGMPATVGFLDSYSPMKRKTNMPPKFSFFYRKKSYDEKNNA